MAERCPFCGRELHELSSREVQVLRLVGSGLTNQGIGRELKISEQTVKNHVTSILHKLDCQDRTAAVVSALKRGQLRLDDLDCGAAG